MIGEFYFCLLRPRPIRFLFFVLGVDRMGVWLTKNFTFIYIATPRK